jgi:hypothetical protein
MDSKKPGILPGLFFREEDLSEQANRLKFISLREEKENLNALHRK